MIKFRKLLMIVGAISAACVLAKFSISEGVSAARAAGPGGGPGGGRGGRGGQVVDTSPRTLAPYFVPVTPGPKAPDAEGFIQRWMLLEPFVNNLRGNTGFNNEYVHNAMTTAKFPEAFATFPHDGDKATVSGQQLTWHALDSTLFNVKLYRFAYGLNKTYYGVQFFAVTVIDSPREIQNVRLAVGSNSASIWWVNGKEVVNLLGDRRMVADDVVSKRLTLKKGANLIQGSVINGPGMSDFCVRFIDEEGAPITDLAVNFEKAEK